jgi:hypothetical protein
MKTKANILNINSSEKRLGFGKNEKWPAQDEQTMYNKLTIGSKDDSLQRKEI